MDKGKEGKKRRKIILIIAIVAVLMLLFFSGKLYLTANLLLGNDLYVKLSSDKENLFLKHNESEKIRFEGYVLTNPFCTATCIYEFKDLSNDAVVEKSSFELKPTITQSKEYVFEAPETGTGQELYRFSMECKSARTFLCQTKEIPRSKSILIILNYDLTDDEQGFKQESKEKITSLMQDLDYLSQDLSNFDSVVADLNRTVIADFFINESEKINSEILAINGTNHEMKGLWENESYGFSEKLDEAEQSIQELESGFDGLNETLLEDMDSYNVLIENLTAMKQNLTALALMNSSNTTVIEINNVILDFNDALDDFAKRNELADKKSAVKKISKKIANAWETVATDTDQCCFANETINDVNASRIEMNATNYSEMNISFEEPVAKCCLFGLCEECCNEACSSENYPIILLHGHDFNRRASAEYSLYTFQNMQNKLDSDGYLNAGSIIISPVGNSSKGAWGMMNYPVTVTASYYFDIYKNKEENEVIQTKTDSLDSYVIRLKDIIDVVKYRTGKDKVIIMAHSMGGIVARRYAQVFGSGDVDRLILIATPNNGIDGTVMKICPLFGAELECRDLDKNSLFMNKLNYGEFPEIPIYNIIGIGCSMDNETGDGVVKNSSAYLETAENYYVNGTCEEIKLRYLHGALLDPTNYPETYELILEILKK